MEVDLIDWGLSAKDALDRIRWKSVQRDNHAPPVTRKFVPQTQKGCDDVDFLLGYAHVHQSPVFTTLSHPRKKLLPNNQLKTYKVYNPLKF